MERQDVIHATIGCAGTVYIGMDELSNQYPELYDLLSSMFGDELSGWEQGDSFYIGVGTGRDPINIPEKPKQRLRPSEARIEAAVEWLIELIQAVRSMDAPLSADDNTWKPTKQARRRLETIVEYVLRGDAKWRNEHPEDEW